MRSEVRNVTECTPYMTSELAQAHTFTHMHKGIKHTLTFTHMHAHTHFHTQAYTFTCMHANT